MTRFANNKSRLKLHGTEKSVYRYRLFNIRRQRSKELLLRLQWTQNVYIALYSIFNAMCLAK